MSERDEYVVGVKAWPAYVLVATLAVTIALYGVALPWLLLSGSGPVLTFLLIVVLVCAAVQVAAMAWAARRAIQVVRHPPRLSADGIRLWLLPTSTYVGLTWDRIAGVRVAVKGLSHGLFVYVHDPVALADGDPGAERRIHREMRRFLGAPFVYPLAAGRRHLPEIDTAVRRFSAGRLALTDGTPARDP